MGILSSIKEREETFQKRLSLLGKKEPSWFLDQRQHAFKRFSEAGLPTRRDEEWKYLNLAPLSATDFGEGKTTQKVTFPDWPSLSDTIIIAIINGKWNAKLSHNLKDLPKEVIIENLSDAMGFHQDLEKNINHPLADSNSLLFLNTAFFDSGLFLSIPDKISVTKSIVLWHIVTHQENSLVLPRSLITLGKSSTLDLVEFFMGQTEAIYLTNNVTEIILGESSQLNHLRIQDENKNSHHFSITHVNQSYQSCYTSATFSSGAHISRQQCHVMMDAEKTQCNLSGLFIAGHNQQMDHHVRIDHLKPEGTSKTLFKGIVDGEAKGIFNGKVIVHPNAWHTNAWQKSNNLLLSPEAEVDPKPQLEIFAHDVKCSHGATVGELDPMALFYLNSRGIPFQKAQELLTYGFAHEFQLPFDWMKSNFECFLTQKLTGLKFGGVHEKV